MNQILHSLIERWSSGNVTSVNGRPIHSQSQGLVEKGNRVIEDKIAAIKREEAAIKREEGYEGQLN